MTRALVRAPWTHIGAVYGRHDGRGQRSWRHSPRHVVRAEDERPNEKSDTDLRQLRAIKSKLDTASAKALLKSWKEERSGGKGQEEELDAREVKKLFKARGARQSGIVARQLAIDGLSAGISWYSAITLASTRSEIPAQFLLFTLAIYQSSNALADLALLVQIGTITRVYAEQAELILRAANELVEESGVGLIDKLRAAIDTAKVLRELDEVLAILRSEIFAVDGTGQSGSDGDSFLRDLGAYLVLVNASSKADGSWMKGTNSELLFSSAGEFAMVDSNDDGYIDAMEFKRLIRGRGIEMNDLEVEVALEALDTNNDKRIDFQEFVEWLKKH